MVRVHTPAVVLTALLAAGCGAQTASSAPPIGSTAPSTSGADASLGEHIDMVSGPLAADVTYVFPGFDGLSVTLTEDGWSAALPNGGDAQISSTTESIYFLWPVTIVSSDGTARRDWPTDPAMAAAQLDAAQGVTIDNREPIVVAGVQTEVLHITAGGLTAEAPLLQTGSGELGFNDGPNDVILLPIGDRLLFITTEGTTDEGSDARTVLDGLSLAD